MENLLIPIIAYMRGSGKFRQGGGVGGGLIMIVFCCHQRVSQRAVRTFFEKQLGGGGRIRISKETYNNLGFSRGFQGGGGLDPLSLLRIPPMISTVFTSADKSGQFTIYMYTVYPSR